MKKEIQQLQFTRGLTLKFLSHLSDEQLLVIPEGFNNNIAWHMGHMVVNQQLLQYKFSNLPLKCDESYVTLFGKGSSPKDWGDQQPDIADIKDLLESLPKELESDYDKGVFKEYKPYTTSMGNTFNDVEDAICFNNFHEGLHIGNAMYMSRLI